ncbi:MAG: hypothetical protein FRX49_06952 [Trebouxia sp. A1-2]|nr:MAG: hypothetical protein FRX49_06952 [Trebouxia sp. A1-2]
MAGARAGWGMPSAPEGTGMPGMRQQRLAQDVFDVFQEIIFYSMWHVFCHLCMRMDIEDGSKAVAVGGGEGLTSGMAVLGETLTTDCFGSPEYIRQLDC